MRNILIHRIDSLLGCYFAGQCLAASSDRVFYSPCASDVVNANEIANLVVRAAEELVPAGGADMSGIRRRLYHLGRDIDVHALGPAAGLSVDETWYFVNSAAACRRTERIEDLIAASANVGAREFNYVEFDCACAPGPHRNNGGGAATSADHAEEIGRAIEQSARIHEMDYRIFRTSLVLGEGEGTTVRQDAGAFSRFLTVLHAFKAEIEERSPHYFDFHALRYFMSADPGINLVSAAWASEALLKVAGAEATVNSQFWVASSRNTPVSEICENLGIAYNLGLLPCANRAELNAVDRAFLERLEQAGCDVFPGNEPAQKEFFALARMSAEKPVLDSDALARVFESVRQKQDDSLAARRREVETLPNRLEARTIPRKDSELKYIAGGKGGAPVVILNALGQGLEYWYRLLNHLVPSHRVFIWEPRGTVAPLPPFGVADQVDDLEAVLNHEGIESCHLVGWCTGAKVAIEFYLRRPSSVKSITFLNGTLKCDGSPEELDSPYEHHLESLCRMMMKKPATAAAVRKTLNSREAEENETDILETADLEQMSVRVLSLMNGDLKASVLAPFRTAETTLNYAHQMVEFWTHDIRPKAAQVDVPVFLMSAEYDQVATPASSFAAAGLFTNARHVHVSGATHYCLYDRAEFVASLLAKFVADPDGYVAEGA